MTFGMDLLNNIKTILLPPKKGDIKLRCKVAVKTEHSDLTKRLLDIDDDCNVIEIDEDNNMINEDDGNYRFKKNWNFVKIPNPFSKLFKREKKVVVNVEELEEDEYYITSPLDTFIGYAVDVAGSIQVFSVIMILLIGWIIWGCTTGATDTWQIVMQDGQSIQTYVWNTFLMRQQLDNDEKLLLLYGRLKSRSITHKRLLDKVIANREQIDFESFIAREKETEFNMKKLIDFKNENTFDKFCSFISKILGSLPTVILYWMGIFVWIGCGKLPINEGTSENPDWHSFSNTWQMYVNTATAIELLFTTVFLENVRARNNDFILKQLELFNELDADLEFLLRDINDDEKENEFVIVKRCPRNSIQKFISLYAHVIGNGLGLIITICVFTAWIAIGNTMHWSANWWLVIGSYTGLIGFIDGFVLREVFFSITNYEQFKFLDLLNDSQELLDIANIPITLERPKLRLTLGNRISVFINKICSSEYSVCLATLVVLGLVILASAMLWSETAQLIANTPTMIIEGFFLLILIQAYNWSEDERSKTLSELTRSRILVHSYIKKHHVN